MLCLKICTDANCLQTSQIQFAHGNGYASVTAKSAAPSRQDVQRTDSLPSLSLSPDVCVPIRASDQIWIDTPQSRSGALTLRARLCAHTYVEKPCDLLGHYFRSGCQAKSAAKLRKTTHVSSPLGCEHADCGRNSPLTGKQNWAGRVRRTPGWVSKVATVLSLCTDALPQDLHGC